MDFYESRITPRAIELATEVLRSGWLSEGTMAKRFEEALASELKLAGPVTVNSGTAAIHLGLAIAGVGPGNEVIIPAQTFVATAMAVMMQHARPVFADIDPRTGNIAPESIRERISPQTRAVIPVHWGGYPCDLHEIGTIASEHGLAVIEDAAHALGATYRGQPVGAISRFTAFSFQAIKHLTTGDGGALCCRASEDEREARSRRWFGIDRLRSVPSHLGERVFDIDAVGYKYHLNDLAAAVGLGNLEGLATQLGRRREIAACYRRELAGVPGLTLLRAETDRESAAWLFTALVENRDDFIRHLATDGIPTSVVHLRIDRYTVFGGRRAGLPGQEAFDAQQISLPVHAGLSEDDVDRIVRRIRQGW
jgi:perosamine synthetase